MIYTIFYKYYCADIIIIICMPSNANFIDEYLRTQGIQNDTARLKATSSIMYFSNNTGSGFQVV